MGACIICGKPTYTQNARHCQECRVAKHKKYCKQANERRKVKGETQKKIVKSPPKKPENKIEAVMRELTLYNKKHGTRYNYGEYTALKRQGRV